MADRATTLHGQRGWHRLRTREMELAAALGLAVTAAGIMALGAGLPVGTAIALAAGAMAAAGVAFLNSDEPRFGSANAVTILRLGLAASLLGQLFAPGEVQLTWAGTCIAALALLLDGVDGWLARRRALVSRFGARLDMEVDTALTVVLTLLLIGTGRVGPWLVLLALLRPAFVLGARYWGWLGAALPPSPRRKLSCVLSIALLILAAAPLTGPVTAPLSALAATVLLLGSFAADVLWLARRRGAVVS